MLETFEALLHHFPDAKERLYSAGLDHTIDVIPEYFNTSPLIWDAAMRVHRLADSTRKPLRDASSRLPFYG